MISSGETTVTVVGRGKGGRNQEFALAMAPLLETIGSECGRRRASAPTASTVPRMRQVPSSIRRRCSGPRPQGCQTPQTFLDNNNAYEFFDRFGDLIRTGPTNTNVGDLQVILIGNL